MADRVVIAGVRRGNTRVAAAELKQACGRAGRSRLGYVDIVVGDSDTAQLKEDMESLDKLTVDSVLDKSADFHLLAEIALEHVQDEESARAWASRSFFTFAGGVLDLQVLIKRLKSLESIQEHEDRLVVTPLGEISSRLYFHPEDILCWRENFQLIFKKEIEDIDVAVAWALSSLAETRLQANVGKRGWYFFEEYKQRLSAYRLEQAEGTLVRGFLYWSLLGGPRLGKLRGEREEIVGDYGRVHQALLGLNKHYHWNQYDFFDNLKVQIEYGVPACLVPLCKIQGIGKTFAFELYNRGVQDLQSLRDNMSVVESIGNAVLIKVVKRAIDEEA